MGQAVIRKAAHDRIPVAQLVRRRFAHTHVGHRPSSASNRRAAVISGGGPNFLLPMAIAPIVSNVRPTIARSFRNEALRMYTRSSASLVLSSLSTYRDSGSVPVSSLSPAVYW